jgi:diguanylate cyclase (GGDEF)-like protein
VREDLVTRLAGRSASVFLAGASALILLTSFLPSSFEEYEYDEAGLRFVSLLGILLGVAGVLLPWERWPRRTAVVMPVLGLGLVLLGAELGEIRLSVGSIITFASLYFVIVAWVGITQPRGTALLLAPLVVLVLGYALATVPSDEGTTFPIAAIVVLIPCGTLVAEGIAYVMESLRQSQSLDLDRVSDLEALADAVSGLRQGASMEEAAEMLGMAANRIFHGDHVTTVLRAADGRLVPARVGAPGSEPGPQATGLVRQAIADGEVAVVGEDGGEHSQLLVIPLLGVTSVGGAVLVRLPRGHADPFRMHLARLFAAQAGNALEQLRVIESLSKDVRRDELTGLGNRRHALDLLESLQTGDAVVLVDLDFFKEVNDTDGHAAGDALLRSLGAHLRECVRDDDLVARLGGDEFILVARSAEADALATVNRLLGTWRSNDTRTSFSAGVAVHRKDDPPAITLEHADVALYRAKQRGRDQVQVYEPVS